MAFEGKDKKQEQTNSPENKSEKELSLSEIDELIKEKAGIFDSLDKYTKDEIFKKIGFSGVVEIKDKAEDDHDSVVYAKAGLGKKFQNFITVGLFKKFFGLVKTKDGEILDKTDIIEGVEGRAWNFVDREGDAYKHEEQKISKQFGINEEDSAKRVITKTYEFVDGKIKKLIRSSRTEEGMIKTAGELREEQIGLCEKKDGAELVSFKESIEKNTESRKNIPKMMGVMSDEEKEKIIVKLDEEESQTKEKIKEKEEKISEELNIFREPFEERLKETIEMENSLKKGLDFIKTEESKLKNQIKKYDDYIKEARKLNLLGDVGGDIVKILEEKKVIVDANAKESEERKVLVSTRLDIIKNNKKEIEATLNRINNVGKTNKEIAEKKKNEKKDETEIKLNEEKTQPETVDGRKKEYDWAEDFSFMGKNEKAKNVSQIEQEEDGEDDKNEKDGGKKWNTDSLDKELTKAWALTDENKKVYQQADKENETGKKVETKKGKKVNAKKKPKKTKDAEDETQNQSNDEDKSDAAETEQVAEREFTDDEIKKFVTEKFKTLGFVNNKNIAEKSKSGLTKRLIEAVKTEILKSEEPITEKYINSEIDDWYRRLTKNKDEESEKAAEKTFTEKEVENIVTAHLKIIGLSKIKDKNTQEQVTKNAIRNAKKMVAESKKVITKNDIIKETKRIFDEALSAGYSKRNS